MYAGRITHHDEVSRLKKVYELVKEARQQVEGQSHLWRTPLKCTGSLLHFKHASSPAKSGSSLLENIPLRSPVLSTAMSPCGSCRMYQP